MNLLTTRYSLLATAAAIFSFQLSAFQLFAQVARVTSAPSITDRLTLAAISDPASPAAGDLWRSSTNADVLKYRSGGTTYSLATSSQLAALSSVYQPLDSDLTAIAALTTTSFGRSLLAAADAAALRTLVGTVIGTDVQAYDADLTTWAGITPGTGIAAALATNTGSTGAPVLFNGNAGTPSALVGTNITGTASGLTAGTVTTNANLTGDVTSTGNATTLATVNANVGSFGSATAAPTFTVNAKGLVTAAGSATITPAWSSITSTPTTAAGYTITNGAAIDALGAVASNGLLTRTAANTYAARTITGTAGQITVTNGDGVSGAPTISLPSTITQATTFSSNTTSTSSTTGAVVVTGGAGFGKDIFVQSLKVGHGANSITTNVGVGVAVLESITTGARNTVVGGLGAAQSLSTGSDNVYVGYRAGNASTGNNNVGVGSLTATNASGSSNMAFGYNVLNGAMSGNYNIGISDGAGSNMTSGSFNLLIGRSTGQSITTGSNNTIMGYRAGLAIPAAGSGSVIVGAYAGDAETSSNTFYVDNQSRGSLSGGRTGALLYGTFDSTPNNQTLTANVGVFTISGTTEATTGGAGSLTTAGGIYAAKKVVALGGVTLSSTGTNVDGIWSATATLDFASIAAAASADLTITVTGASVGDIAELGLPAAPAAGITWDCFVSSANTVTIRATNITASSIDPASATYRATVISH